LVLRPHKLIILSLLLLGFLTMPAFAGNLKTNSDTLIIAGKHYQRSFAHRFFWGTHYRKIWAEPVQVPYLYLSKENLKPTEMGGSYQTKNLRLVDPEGKEYVLRSIEKDPTRALPVGLRKTFIGNLMQDQTSVIHPYGALVVPQLADAAGVLHASPRLVVVADDPALGEFRPEFANMFAMLEERPDGNQKETANFGYSKKLESSKDFFEGLMKSNCNQVAAREYLRARLFDMWLGDWSRREDQWRWATYKNDDGTVKYRPIPRDRDHAFFKFNDGFITKIVSVAYTNFQTFGPKIKHIEGLNQTARPMDNSLLVYLSEEDFKTVADSLVMQLSDPVIEAALKVWPENIYKLSAAEFEKNLKSRRRQLPAVAKKYYRILAKSVYLPGTDDPETFVLTAQADHSILLEVFRNKKSCKADSLINSRTFKARETKKLRIYGLGGKDKLILKGQGQRLPKVYFYDGAGEDEVKDKTSGKFRRKVKVLSAGDGNEIKKTKNFKISDHHQPKAIEYDGTGWLLRHRLH
jgi:hypothetical protein